LTNSSKYNLCIHCFCCVSAIAAAFVGTTVHQVSLQRTVSNDRSVEVGRTPYIGETGRAFGVRLQERRQEVTQCDVRAYTWSTSKFAATEQNTLAVTDHAISLNHIIDWDCTKGIDKESNRMDQ